MSYIFGKKVYKHTQTSGRSYIRMKFVLDGGILRDFFLPLILFYIIFHIFCNNIITPSYQHLLC